MRRISLLAFISIAVLFASLDSSAQGQAPSKGAAKKTIELDTIEIKVNIQEPTLLYILDQPTFEIETYEETLDFLKKIQKPVEENQLQ